jgi:hypothetical protein
MIALASPADRAAVCVGCHVGAPADENRKYPVRDMNHDMIAAGHPRLNFDYAEYLRRLPKHWHDPTAPNPAGEWLIGRVVHAEAACRLLADRAKRAMENDSRSPWPEFAEFDCAACHHRFASPDEPGERPSGALRWQALWPVAESDAAGRGELAELRALISPRVPSAAMLVAPADQAALKLEALRKTLAGKPGKELEGICRGLFAGPVPTDPDAMEQMLYGLAAFERVSRREEMLEKFNRAFGRFQNGGRDREWREAVRGSLNELRTQLRQ